METYGEGRLEPAIGDTARGAYLQWLHYAESSAFGPLGNIVWLTQYRTDASEHPALVADVIGRAQAALIFVEKGLKNKNFLIEDTFTAADIMMGFTLLAAQTMGQLSESTPNLNAYLARLMQRTAFQRTFALLS